MSLQDLIILSKKCEELEAKIGELERKLGCYLTTLARISNANNEPDYDDKINVIIREALAAINKEGV